LVVIHIEFRLLASVDESVVDAVKEVKGNGRKPSLAGNSTFLFIVTLLFFWIKGLIRPERQNKT
jgi:hypothetical protein